MLSFQTMLNGRYLNSSVDVSEIAAISADKRHMMDLTASTGSNAQVIQERGQFYLMSYFMGDDFSNESLVGRQGGVFVIKY